MIYFGGQVFYCMKLRLDESYMFVIECKEGKNYQE